MAYDAAINRQEEMTVTIEEFIKELRYYPGDAVVKSFKVSVSIGSRSSKLESGALRNKKAGISS